MYTEKVKAEQVDRMAEITDTKAMYMNGKVYIYRKGSLLAGGLSKREALATLDALYEYDRQREGEREEAANTAKRVKKDRLEFVKAMHEIVCALNNEGYYYDRWINVMPDCPTEEDFEDFTEEDNKDILEELAAMFEYIMTEACKEEKPFYVGGNCI